ncbi:MAG: hypothetical protein WCY14_05330 [Arcobacteraceae bacterium]
MISGNLLPRSGKRERSSTSITASWLIYPVTIPILSVSNWICQFMISLIILKNPPSLKVVMVKRFYH